MALYPFVLLQDPRSKKDPVLLRHEQIHLQQQKELLILPFYLLYLSFYLYNLYRFGDHQTAYFQIPFEREAYRYEKDAAYLKQRRFWAWLL